MNGTIVERVATQPPPAGHHLHVARLTGTESVPLTELHARAGRLAARLGERGVRAGDRIGILARNSLEWVLLDLAALRLKAVTAGFEPGKFDPDPALLTRYGLRVLFTDQPVDAAPGPDLVGIRALAEVTDLVEAPGPVPDLPPPHWAPGEATTIKFTSGSTGQPKGLAASVGSIDSSIRAVQEMFAHGPGDDIFVFLPLSLLQQRYWIYSALAFGHDVTVSTYEAAFVAMRRVRPTVVMGVPAFFEAAKRHVEAGARRVGGDGTAALRTAARAVFGDRIRYLWTGSAPASPTMLDFYDACGLPIYEGYGLNETCIVSKNHPGAHRRGSVGRVLPGKQVLLDADGVVSIRSEHPVDVRYTFAAPGESERVFGADGVVRTGDLGHLDEDGFLYIRGRADDVIVLDNGKKVIVRPIEERMRTSPAIEECVVFCPTQTHLVAVVSPAQDPPDLQALTEHLHKTNAELTADEQIHKVVVARPRFSIDNGLLTSQYKPRRQRIHDLFRAEILSPEEGIHAQ